MPGRPRVLVSGMMAGVPGLGGAAWAVLNYLLGFARLGCDTWFVEPVAVDRLRPAGASLAASDNAAYFRAVADRFGLTGRSALLLAGSRDTVGVPYPELVRAARSANVLVNTSGMLTDPELVGPVPVRVYLDVDPGFVQWWHTQGVDLRLAGHTHFATFGGRIGRPDCPVPTCGREWIPTLPPVELSEWPADTRPTDGALTGVAHWRGYGTVTYQGVRYGQKAHSLRPLFDLPARAAARFRLALAIDPGDAADLAALRANGWELIAPDAVTSTPDAYRDFVSGAWAEFGVAKEGYVRSRCGWFSDRTACYLAAGRPAVVQDTGFTDRLPAGRGLLTFATADDAVAAIESLRSDYPGHAAAAREVAVEHLAADRVLPALLDRVGCWP